MKIDISEELHDHYQLVKTAAEDAVADANATAAGKSTLLNSVTTILKELAKIQLELHNSSQIAMLQASIVEALEEASPELKSRTLEILEKRLAALS